MRPSAFPRTLFFALIASVCVFLVQAPLLAGPINDPLISIGGVPDPPNVPGIGNGFSFYTTTGTSGTFGASGGSGADCYEGAAGSGTLVTNCIFVNNTGHAINNLFVSIPVSLQGKEAFSCASSTMFNCTEVYNSNTMETGISFTAASASADGDDTSLTDGDGDSDDYIQISVGPAPGSTTLWPANTDFTVSTPEPPAGLLMLSGLFLLAMAGWFTRRRRAVA